MKKILATILALMMILTASAIAETTPAEIQTVDMGELPIAYEQNWLTFDTGLTLCVPSDWVQLDIAADLAELGTIYLAQDAAATFVAGLSYTATDAMDNQALAVALTEEFVEVYIIQLNGAEFVTYVDPADTFVGFVTVDGAGGMYSMTYKPVPSEDFAVTAATIMSTLGMTEVPAATTEG